MWILTLFYSPFLAMLLLLPSLKSSPSTMRVQPITRSTAMTVCLVLLLLSVAAVSGVAGVDHYDGSFARTKNSPRSEALGGGFTSLWKNEVSFEYRFHN